MKVYEVIQGRKSHAISEQINKWADEGYVLVPGFGNVGSDVFVVMEFDLGPQVDEKAYQDLSFPILVPVSQPDVSLPPQSGDDLNAPVTTGDGPIPNEYPVTTPAEEPAKIKVSMPVGETFSVEAIGSGKEQTLEVEYEESTVEA